MNEKPKINVLFASSKYMPEYSGSGFRAHNQYKRLTAKYPEINVTVVCGSESENTCARYQYDGFEIERIACKPFTKLREGGLWRKYQIARNFNAEYSKTMKMLDGLKTMPDIVHVFGESYAMIAVLNYAIKKGIPAIIELCNEMDTPFMYVPFSHKMWVSSAFPAKYNCVCISERLKKMCQRNGIPEESIWSRPNPVDEDCFYPVDASVKNVFRKKLTKFSEDDKLLLYIANFKTSKNHGFLIDVIKHLPSEFKLYLGGPLEVHGPKAKKHQMLFDEMVKRVKDENLEDRIQIVCGFCKDIGKFYQMADAYMFPTLHEGLGTPMLESISCGLPVVANIIPGITDFWINDGENGFLSELDPKIFAEKTKLALNFSEEHRRSEAEKMIKKTGTEVIDKEYYALINSLIGKKTQ